MPDRPPPEAPMIPDDPSLRGRIAVVYGTRPEVIKLAGIIAELGNRALLLHTGQHFSPELSADIARDVGVGDADVTLEIGNTTRGEQIGEGTARLDRAFRQLRPRAVVVQGDTNSALAGALAANAVGIPLVHVEAGLRSWDRAMPEEHNRVLIDHISDLCCAPTETSRCNLLAEGIEDRRIVVTGNTVIEAVLQMVPDVARRRQLVDRLGVEPGRFVLATFHRPENVDAPEALAQVLELLAEVPLPVVLPLHPRTRARASSFGLEHLLDPLLVVPPVAYRDFLGLSAEAAFLVSDSGGVQEEVSVLKRPVIVVRASTERPEVLGTFAERVPLGPGVADLARRWCQDLAGLHARLASLPSPYGDGTASARSVAAMQHLLSTDEEAYR
jgi:UDP-N-acetylglucosamine 2-epimerase (non-hydrolysing)